MAGTAMHEHIQYLLYRHNCVILPGFGGIVLQYAPAHIHPTQHVFQPPRKAIAFNRSLTTNDGLLIAHVANAENLHYDEAEKLVRKFVDGIDDNIRRKGESVLPGIGKFRNDVEGNLQFEPSDAENYWLGAFGLEPFVSPAVVRREAFEPGQATASLKKKRKFNWFGWTSVLLLTVLLTVEILNIQDLNSILQRPLAGFDIGLDSGKLVPTPAAQPKEKTNGTRDTLVQIIVIREEGNDKTSETSVNTSPTKPIVETPVNANLKDAIIPDAVVAMPNVDTRTAEQKVADSLRLLANSKVPMRGEYNPAQLGKYVIVFSNSTDSTKAAYFQQQLWRDRIGAQLIPHRNRLLVAKPGYYTARAAAKDLTIYRMLGYGSAYIMKTRH
jgi:hypothetical protein